MAVWDILFPVTVADPFIENIECSEGVMLVRSFGRGGGSDPGCLRRLPAPPSSPAAGVDPRIVAVVEGLVAPGFGRGRPPEVRRPIRFYNLRNLLERSLQGSVCRWVTSES